MTPLWCHRQAVRLRIAERVQSGVRIIDATAGLSKLSFGSDSGRFTAVAYPVT
jgi:hypothetical protein